MVKSSVAIYLKMLYSLIILGLWFSCLAAHVFYYSSQSFNKIMVETKKIMNLKSVYHILHINGRDVQRKNVVNNVDKSSLWAP